MREASAEYSFPTDVCEVLFDFKECALSIESGVPFSEHNSHGKFSWHGSDSVSFPSLHVDGVFSVFPHGKCCVLSHSITNLNNHSTETLVSELHSPVLEARLFLVEFPSHFDIRSLFSFMFSALHSNSESFHNFEHEKCVGICGNLFVLSFETEKVSPQGQVFVLVYRSSDQQKLHEPLPFNKSSSDRVSPRI